MIVASTDGNGRGERDVRLLIASVGCGVAFMLLVLLVGSGWSTAFDMRIVLALRDATDPGLPIGRPSVREIGRDVTAIGGSVLFVVVVVAVVAFRRERASYATLLFAVLGARVAAALLKFAIGRPRPDAIIHSTFVHTTSFPSTHVTVASATYLALAFLLARRVPERSDRTMIYWLAAILVAGVGASRVYLGVHWPTDALAGWLVGGGWSLLVAYVDPLEAFGIRIQKQT